MSAPVSPSPPNPASVASAPASTTRSLSDVPTLAANARPGGTVAFLQRWSLILPILFALMAVVGAVGSFVVQGAARSTTESTAPSLIAIQDLSASVAEANTAATAAHLSVDATGSEDRASRNLYLDALRRANRQLALVSANLGTEAQAQGELQNIGASLATFSGEVEAARLAKSNGLAEADDRLRSALAVIDTEVQPSVTTITEFGQADFDNEADEGQFLILIALAAAVATLAVMIWMQVQLARRTRRILNPLLVLSTLALLTALGLLLGGEAVRQSALDDARVGGYDAITASSQMQASTFNLQSQLGLLLLDDSSGGGGGDRVAAVDSLVAEAEATVADIQARADSEREQAAANALAVRWDRYGELVDRVTALAGRGDRTTAVAVFQGEGLSVFNGVNTAIESVLSDNRQQFSDGVDTARSAVDLLPWLYLALSVVAGLLAVVALQRRLGEYR